MRMKDSIDLATQTPNLTRQLASRIAREFRGSTLSGLWTFFADQNMIVDVLVMDVMRLKDSADSTRANTATEIIEFRTMLVEELAKKGWRIIT